VSGRTRPSCDTSRGWGQAPSERGSSSITHRSVFTCYGSTVPNRLRNWVRSVSLIAPSPVKSSSSTVPAGLANSARKAARSVLLTAPLAVDVAGEAEETLQVVPALDAALRLGGPLIESSGLQTGYIKMW